MCERASDTTRETVAFADGSRAVRSDGASPWEIDLGAGGRGEPAPMACCLAADFCAAQNRFLPAAPHPEEEPRHA